MHRSLRKISYKLRRLFGPALPAIIAAVRKDKLSYLSKGALEDLYERVSVIEKKELPGMIIEAGCVLGGGYPHSAGQVGIPCLFTMCSA
jgi:hypothetical protein